MGYSGTDYKILMFVVYKELKIGLPIKGKETIKTDQGMLERKSNRSLCNKNNNLNQKHKGCYKEQIELKIKLENL